MTGIDKSFLEDAYEEMTLEVERLRVGLLKEIEMSKIPDDILKAAKRAYMTYPKAGEDEWMPIARAFLAEREKYASIADKYAQNNKDGRNPQSFAAYTVATEIARDIRSKANQHDNYILQSG